MRRLRRTRFSQLCLYITTIDRKNKVGNNNKVDSRVENCATLRGVFLFFSFSFFLSFFFSFFFSFLLPCWSRSRITYRGHQKIRIRQGEKVPRTLERAIQGLDRDKSVMDRSRDQRKSAGTPGIPGRFVTPYRNAAGENVCP